MYLFMRLAREWDLRFEKLYLTNKLAKWYSSVGNEAVTVPVTTAMNPGDALCTLHRDSGAILRYYLDAHQLFDHFFPKPSRRRCSTADSKELLYRLAAQMLGRADGFSNGYERSYHYNLFQEDDGIVHIGMISHLGSLIPVAAGAALAFQQQGEKKVAVNFVGDGATSTGDFHEGLNMAAVLKLPLVLVIENNQYAFSTPTSEQFASKDLACRGESYGIPGIRVDGNDPEEVWKVASTAIARARKGQGPTLIEAVVGRMRGHSQGDDSLKQVPENDLQRFMAEDPMTAFEQRLLERGVITEADAEDFTGACAELLVEITDRAAEAAMPNPDEERPTYAE